MNYFVPSHPVFYLHSINCPLLGLKITVTIIITILVNHVGKYNWIWILLRGLQHFRIL